jgi:hypothetical protein
MNDAEGGDQRQATADVFRDGVMTVREK